MRKFLLLFGVLAISAMPVFADPINLQYTTFGGNTAVFEGPLTAEMGTAVVTGNSAILTSNNAEVGAVTMDTSLSSHANFVSLKFDIDILSQTAAGYDQNFGGAQTLGGVRIVQNGIFAESFQFMPTSTTTGTFAFRNVDATAVQTVGDYATNTLYHIELDADYLTGMASAYINGNLAYSGYPLRPGTGAGGTTSEIFVYLNGATPDGTHNSFMIGDTAATPAVSTPLPSVASAGMLCMGALAVSQVVRRRRGTAVAMS